LKLVFTIHVFDIFKGGSLNLEEARRASAEPRPM